MLSLFEQTKLSPCWLIHGALDVTLPFVQQLAHDILISPLNKTMLSPDMISRHIHAQSYGNYLYIQPNTDNEITLEEIQGFHQFCQRKSIFNGARVIVINHMDVMNRFVVNSLLKTLEEPPHQLFIFLLVKQIKNILPTIRSRCQVLSLDNQEQSTQLPDTIDPILQKAVHRLFEKVMHNDYTNLQGVCDPIIQGDKENYRLLAHAFLQHLYEHICTTHHLALTERWLILSRFWSESQLRYLDLQHAFFAMLTGMNDLEYVMVE